MSRLSSFQIRLLFAGIVVLAIVLGGNAPSHGATGEWESGLRPVDARIFEKWAKVSEVYAKETEWLVENAVARRNPAARSFEALIAVASTRFIARQVHPLMLWTRPVACAPSFLALNISMPTGGKYLRP